MENSPPESSRRRFLGGVVGGAVVGAAGVGAATVLTTATPGETSGGLIRYRGMRQRGGPAPRPLPQVPVGVDEDGYLYGQWPESAGESGRVPTGEIGGVPYSANWFRYCAFTDYRGFEPDAPVDSYFRTPADAPYAWQGGSDAGERLNVQDFADYETWGNGVGAAGLGKPALTTWRVASSEATPGTVRPFPVQVVRSPRVGRLREEGNEWIRASTSESGFIAWAATCTHNCAVTGFKASEESERFHTGDVVYCPDCQSTFRPFEVVEGEHVVSARGASDTAPQSDS